MEDIWLLQFQKILNYYLLKYRSPSFWQLWKCASQIFCFGKHSWKTPDAVSQDLLKSHTCPGCSQLLAQWGVGAGAGPFLQGVGLCQCRTLAQGLSTAWPELSENWALPCLSSYPAPLLSPFPFTGPTCIMVWGFSLSIPLLPTSFLDICLLEDLNWCITLLLREIKDYWELIFRFI